MSLLSIFHQWKHVLRPLPSSTGHQSLTETLQGQESELLLKSNIIHHTNEPYFIHVIFLPWPLIPILKMYLKHPSTFLFYKAKPIRITAVLPTETRKTRRKWSNVFQILKKIVSNLDYSTWETTIHNWRKNKNFPCWRKTKIICVQ
jgi:hypothetical protein